MRPRSIGLSAMALAVLLGAPRLARADSSAVAEALFLESRQLMEAKRFDEACPKLAESQRLDPKLGTLLNLATCHELQGKTASAWAELSEAASQAARAGRTQNEAFAREHLAAVSAKLARVVLRAEHAPPGLTLSVDHQDLGGDALGSSLPLDPGTHVIGATAPGRVAWQRSIVVAPGPSEQIVRIPELASTSANDVAPPPKPLPSDAPASSGPSALGLVFGGVALVGAGVGTFLGVRAFSKNDAAKGECKPTGCTQAGLDLDHDGRVAATGSTIAFVVAGVAAAGSVYFFATGSKRAPVAVAVSPFGASLRGAW